MLPEFPCDTYVLEFDPEGCLKLDTNSSYRLDYRVKKKKKYEDIPFGILKFRGSWTASIYPLHLFDVLSLIVEARGISDKSQMEVKISNLLEMKLPAYLHYPLVMTFIGMGLAEFIQKYRATAISPKSVNSDASIAKEKGIKELLDINTQYKLVRHILLDTEKLCSSPDTSMFRALKTGILKEGESLSDLLMIPSGLLQQATSLFVDTINESIDRGRDFTIGRVLEGNFSMEISRSQEKTCRYTKNGAL